MPVALLKKQSYWLHILDKLKFTISTCNMLYLIIILLSFSADTWKSVGWFEASRYLYTALGRVSLLVSTYPLLERQVSAFNPIPNIIIAQPPTKATALEPSWMLSQHCERVYESSAGYALILINDLSKIK
jgi:hypothetical protein